MGLPRALCRLRHGELQARKPYRLGLQVSTKYRYGVLGGDVGQRCRELLRETARAHEMVVHAGSINRDHVHMLLSIPPSPSVSRAVQYLKGRSSHKLLAEFASLRKRYWGQHLWARGYWVASSGANCSCRRGMPSCRCCSPFIHPAARCLRCAQLVR